MKGRAGSRRLRQAGQPLAIISRDGEYPWGKSQLACPEHSDFLHLQDQLLRLHPQMLIDQTEAKYKQYRTARKQKENAKLEEERSEREREQARQREELGREKAFQQKLYTAALALLVMACAGALALVATMFAPPTTPRRGMPFHAAVHIKNDSLSLGSRPLDLKEIVSIHAFHTDTDSEDLQLNISGRHGLFKIKPGLCNESLPGILGSGSELQITSSPQEVSKCVECLQYQAGADVREGEDLILFSYMPIPDSRKVLVTVPVNLKAAAVASTSQLAGSLISDDQPAAAPSDLTLIAHDGLGDALTAGGDECWVHIVGRFALGHVQQNITVRLHDNGDGTYFTSAVRPHGEYKLFVQINGDATAPYHVRSSDAVAEADLRSCRDSLERSENTGSNLATLSNKTLEKLEAANSSEKSCQKLLNETQWSKHNVEVERGQLSQAREKLNEELSLCKSESAELSSKFGTCDSTKESCVANLSSRSQLLNICRDDLSDAQLQLDSLRSNLSGAQAKSVSIEAKSVGCQQQLHNMSSTNKQLNDRLVSAETRLHEQTRKVNSVEADNTNLASELSKCESGLRDFGAEHAHHAMCKTNLADCLGNLTVQKAHRDARESNRPPTIGCGSDVSVSEGEEARQLQ